MRLKTPHFWYRRPSAPAPALEKALTPLSFLYRLGSAANQRFSDPEKCGIPVICIGNLVAGGSGKTPSAIALMQLIREKQLFTSPHFLTRGFGGSESGPLLVDYFKHKSEEIGDESLLLAKNAFTVVSTERAAGARLAVQKGADLVIMDDGLQNNSLHKDLNFIVIDGSVGFGNEKLLPAGPLREPLNTGLARADAFILIGKDKAGVLEILPEHKPVFNASVEVPNNAKPDPGKKYVAFAGLGRPEKFYQQLQHFGLDIVGWHPFPDHYPYTAEEIQKLTFEAKEKGAILITSEKDYKRIPDADWAVEIAHMPIELIWQDETALLSFLKERLPS